uniref:Uncharacterized protein n=1 Tax=Moniliophthora roreri TaxID=221103 RepID=A0A0W0FQ04_MONRR
MAEDAEMEGIVLAGV